jgi:integrase
VAKFVEGFADKLKVPAGAKDVQVFDDELRGFGIRKFASGATSYFVKFNVGTQQRRKTLGKVVRGNLKAMRLEASTVLAKARLGTDVVAVAKTAKAKNAVPTLGGLVPKYLEYCEGRLREKSLTETHRYLAGTKHKRKADEEKERERTPSIFKPLYGRPIDAISRDDIKEILHSLEHKVAADRARAALSGLYVWAIDRRKTLGCGALDINPTIGIKAQSENGRRTRKLSEAELVQVWSACGDDDFGRSVKLLILTGQRKTEIGDLRWYEIDMDKREIALPPPRCKNGKAMAKAEIDFHIVPLSDQALAIIKPIQRGDREQVFGRGPGGFKGWDAAKQALDARIAASTRKPLPHWTLHDIRRSVVTRLTESRRDAPGARPYSFAAPHIAEAITNHLSGHKGGVAGTYNRAEYEEGKREALELWGAHIARLVSRPAKPAKPKQSAAHRASVTAA